MITNFPLLVVALIGQYALAYNGYSMPVTILSVLFSIYVVVMIFVSQYVGIDSDSKAIRQLMLKRVSRTSLRSMKNEMLINNLISIGIGYLYIEIGYLINGATMAIAGVVLSTVVCSKLIQSKKKYDASPEEYNKLIKVEED